MAKSTRRDVCGRYVVSLASFFGSTRGGNCSSMKESWNRPPSTEKFSWRVTVLTQAALCLALYGAFSIGTPHESRNAGLMSRGARRREFVDSYFLSVRGGFWPADERTQLLQQVGGYLLACLVFFFF